MASGSGSSSRKRRDHKVVKIQKNLHKIKKKKINDLNKDPSAAVAASEEMVPHLNIIWSLKMSPNKSAHTASKDS